jgi:hypothetical protein
VTCSSKNFDRFVPILLLLSEAGRSGRLLYFWGGVDFGENVR